MTSRLKVDRGVHALRGLRLGLREPSRPALGRPQRLHMRRCRCALPGLQRSSRRRSAADASRLQDRGRQGRLAELTKLMTDTDFKTTLLENEVVVAHVAEGHIYRFRILLDGIISMHGSVTEPNPDSAISARRLFAEAYAVARDALTHATWPFRNFAAVS
jgi:hypothetical protein